MRCAVGERGLAESRPAGMAGGTRSGAVRPGTGAAEPAERTRAAEAGAGRDCHGVSKQPAGSGCGRDGRLAGERGPRLSLTQTIGGASSGGGGELLGRGTLGGLAVNDSGGGSRAGDDLKSRRLELKFGYGFAACGDRFTWMPEAGVGLSDTGRDYSLGWRLLRGGAGVPDGGAFELSFEARRHENDNDNGDTRPEHEVGLRLTARW